MTTLHLLLQSLGNFQLFTMFSLEHTSVGCFQQRISSDDTDSGEYIFEVESMLDYTTLVTSMSDNSLTLSNSSDLRTIAKTSAHSSTINRIEVSKVNPHLLFSCSDDRKTLGWDTRCFDKPALVINQSEEVTALSVGVNGTLMATASESKINFYDIRFFNGGSSTGQRAGKLGSYADVHSDMITQLKFHPIKTQLLTSAAEDGLICIYDTSTSETEEAIVSVLNTECPVNKFGYFGVDYEGIYSLSTVETLSFWHYPSAQRVAHFPTIREGLNADYLVDCYNIPNTNEIYLLAGDYNGQGVISQMEPNRFNVKSYLTGGHSANMRCCSANFMSPTPIGGVRLITGGEDSRLCSWTTTNTPTSNNIVSNSLTTSNVGNNNQGNSRSSGSVGGGRVHGAGNTHMKAKKDSTKMRFKPY